MADLFSTVPEVTIFVRHSRGCSKRVTKPLGRPLQKTFAMVLPGTAKPAKTRSWAEAAKQRTKLLRQFGETDDPVIEPADRRTIEQAVEIFLTRKQTEGVSGGVLKKYRRELDRLQKFFACVLRTHWTIMPNAASQYA